MNFWDFSWLLIWSYVFIAYLIALFHIIADVFRDPGLGGFSKALWMIALIIFPVGAALIYLIARGRGMAARKVGAPQQVQGDTDHYIHSVADQPSPAEQVASAKILLDDGSITQPEYER